MDARWRSGEDCALGLRLRHAVPKKKKTREKTREREKRDGFQIDELLYLWLPSWLIKTFKHDVISVSFVICILL
jgi:hypothetical protein